MLGAGALIAVKLGSVLWLVCPLQTSHGVFLPIVILSGQAAMNTPQAAMNPPNPIFGPTQGSRVERGLIRGPKDYRKVGFYILVLRPSQGA